MHKKIWFINRINKKIYRDRTSCRCAVCEDVVKNGIVIRDKEQAEYLYLVQCEMGIEYRDKK